MADVSFGHALMLATSLGLQDAFPAKLGPYLQALQERPAFRRAQAAQPGTPAQAG